MNYRQLIARIMQSLILSGACVVVGAHPSVAQDASAEQQAREAAEIARSVLGPKRPIDEAYGAFQTGYYLTALQLALPRAQNDDAAAQTLIAELYANGLGVAQSYARASSWYALADKNGDLNATFQLALLYQNGLGVPKNRQKAAELTKKAADGGIMAAVYNLAQLHVEGRYVEPNLGLAAKLFKQAADATLLTHNMTMEMY